MAQTKTRSKSGGSKGSSSKRSGGQSTSRKSSSGARSASQAKTRAASGAKKSAKGAGATAKAAGEQVRSSTAQTLDKAKVPLVAGGAALLGIAGGVAASRNGRRRGSLASRMPKPKMKMPKANLKRMPNPKDIKLPKADAKTFDWVEQNARRVGDAGHRVAELSSEARSIQESVSRRK